MCLYYTWLSCGYLHRDDEREDADCVVKEGVEVRAASARLVKDMSELDGVVGKSASTIPRPCPPGKRGELVRRTCCVFEAAVFDLERRTLSDESVCAST